MNYKPVAAVVAIVILEAIILLPPLASGSLAVTVAGDAPPETQHFLVTVTEIWVHRTGTDDFAGWTKLTNQSRTYDLAFLKNHTTPLSTTILGVGRFDKFRVRINNATVTINGTTKVLELQSSEMVVQLPLNVGLSQQTHAVITIIGRITKEGTRSIFMGSLNATLGRPR